MKISIEGKLNGDNAVLVVKKHQDEAFEPPVIVQMWITPSALVEVAEELSGNSGVMPANKKQMLELLEYVDGMGTLQHFFAHDHYELQESVQRVKNARKAEGRKVY